MVTCFVPFYLFALGIFKNRDISSVLNFQKFEFMQKYSILIINRNKIDAVNDRNNKMKV